MKVQGIIIGKRVTIAAAINSTLTVVAAFYPEQAVKIMGLAVPLTLIAQVIIANKLGVTT